MSHLKKTVTVIQVGSRSRYTYLSNDEQIAEIVAAEGKKVGIGCSSSFIGCHDDVAQIPFPWPRP